MLFSHRSLNRLKDLVAEHLDHLHYLNDILCLQIDALNAVLTDHLLNRLFIPLYIYSIGAPHSGVNLAQADVVSNSTSSTSKLQVRSSSSLCDQGPQVFCTSQRSNLEGRLKHRPQSKMK